jgi:CBS-domain-containing membrane protein
MHVKAGHHSATGFPMPGAIDRMHKEHIRRSAVATKNGELDGIFTVSNLLKTSPSEATSLSTYEVTCLLGKLTIERIKSRDVFTLADETPL